MTNQIKVMRAKIPHEAKGCTSLLCEDKKTCYTSLSLLNERTPAKNERSLKEKYTME